MRFLPSLLLLLLAAPAHAAPDAASAASAAAEVADEHCSDTAADAQTKAARAVAAVAPVLAEVSEAHDATGEAWLLYWRGLLQACIDREERAILDFRAFLAEPDPDGIYAAQRQDAERRLRRLEIGASSMLRDQAGGPQPGGLITGGALLGGGAVLGGLSGLEGSVAAQQESIYRAGLRPWSETQEAQIASEAAAGRANGLLVGAIGLGVGGAVAFAITAATAKGRPGVSAVVVPTDGGVALSIGGRW